MKTWKIPVTWEVFGFIEEEAETLEEAIEKAEEFEREIGYDLPTEPDYIDGSFTIETDVEYVQIFNQEK